MDSSAAEVLRHAGGQFDTPVVQIRRASDAFDHQELVQAGMAVGAKRPTELNCLISSRAAMTALAENFVGLPT